MAHATEDKPRPATFQRVYEASVEEVWALWTTKDGLEEWFAPEGIRVEVRSLDVRAGGAFTFVHEAVRDEEIAFLASMGRVGPTLVQGRFVEVVPHERLHIRLTVDFVASLEPYPVDIVVTFASSGPRVRMVVTAGLHADVEMTRLASLGMESELRRFDVALASRRRLGARWMKRQARDS